MNNHRALLRRALTLFVPLAFGFLIGASPATAVQAQAPQATSFLKCPPGTGKVCTPEGPGGTIICFCEPY
jgi:hypothetical protein